MSKPSKTGAKVAVKRDEHGRILPGQPSLNPDGRPVLGKAYAERIRDLLNVKLPPWSKIPYGWRKTIEETPLRDMPLETWADFDIVQMMADAFAGDQYARKELHDRAYGKPVQALSDPDGGPLVATIIYGGVVPPSQAQKAGG